MWEAARSPAVQKANSMPAPGPIVTNAPQSLGTMALDGAASISSKAKRNEAEDWLPYRLSARTVGSSSARSSPSEAVAASMTVCPPATVRQRRVERQERKYGTVTCRGSLMREERRFAAERAEAHDPNDGYTRERSHEISNSTQRVPVCTHQ